MSDLNKSLAVMYVFSEVSDEAQALEIFNKLEDAEPGQSVLEVGIQAPVWYPYDKDETALDVMSYVEDMQVTLERSQEPLAQALKACIEALYNAPEVGGRYDQQHSDTAIAAILGAKSALGMPV